MNPFTAAVFAVINGEKTQVGWATKETEKGVRRVKLGEDFKYAENLGDLSFIDDFELETEKVPRDELALEEGATRQSLKDKPADKA